MSNAHYYIGTGAKNCFYTLRYTFTEQGRRHVGDGNFEVFTVVRDYHICNLSTDREAAVSKAHERTGQPLSAAFEVCPIKRRDEIDWSFLQGGKYQGQSIHELRETEEGRAYLCFLAENCAGNSRYEKTVELIKALLEHEVAGRAVERRIAGEERKAKQAKVAELCQPVIAILKAQKGDFCASIASDLENGNLPGERAIRIVCDIFAKAHGRRNSNAYSEAYDQADSILASAINA